jgi:hypothetical protein
VDDMTHVMTVLRLQEAVCVNVRLMYAAQVEFKRDVAFLPNMIFKTSHSFVCFLGTAAIEVNTKRKAKRFV